MFNAPRPKLHNQSSTPAHAQPLVSVCQAFPTAALLHTSTDQSPAKGLPSASQDRDQAVVDFYQTRLQQTVAAQDQELQHISLSVSHIRNTGQAIHDELEEQVGGPAGGWHLAATACMRLSTCWAWIV
jgi:hypothetical protein